MTMDSAVVWQRAEGGVMAAVSVGVALAVGPEWPIWLWVVLMLAPDLAFFGYLAGQRIGAGVYNLLHLYGAGMVLVLLGTVLSQPWLIAAGALWVAHVGLDRALGYGLKLPSGFKDTHLGRIGRD